MIRSKQLLEGEVLEGSKDSGLAEQTWIAQMMEAWSV